MWKYLIPTVGLAWLPAAAIANGESACAPRAHIVLELAEKYRERQVAIGLAESGQLMELYAGPTNDWTLLATRPDGVSCIMGVGSHLGLVPEAPVAPPRDPA